METEKLKRYFVIHPPDEPNYMLVCSLHSEDSRWKVFSLYYLCDRAKSKHTSPHAVKGTVLYNKNNDTAAPFLCEAALLTKEDLDYYDVNREEFSHVEIQEIDEKLSDFFLKQGEL